VMGPQIPNSAATRSPSLASCGPSGNVSSDGTSPSFVTQLGAALGAHTATSVGPGPKDGKRLVKAGRDSGSSENLPAVTPAPARPSVSQAAFETSSARPKEARTSDQQPDQPLQVQPLATDPHPVPPSAGLETSRAPRAFTAQSESPQAAGPNASTAVDNQTVGNQTEPVSEFSSRPRPSGAYDAETPPYAGSSDTSNLTQTEFERAVLQDGQRIAPGSPASATQSDGRAVGSPEPARPSLLQAFETSSARPNEAVATDQPADQSLVPLQHNLALRRLLALTRAPLWTIK
jgi:hypothetical protein